MPKTFTYGLTHLAITVNDVERTLTFYREVFDMEVMYHTEGFIQLTTPGCNDILVFEEKTDKLIGESGGIAHFGFRLKNPSDIDVIVNRIIKAGGTVINRGEFVPGSPFVFFKDLDGYEVEVWYELLK
jgi:catechol 2,3-dioxygenase-like lactoylglutathione lyase family enzyme